MVFNARLADVFLIVEIYLELQAWKINLPNTTPPGRHKSNRFGPAPEYWRYPSRFGCARRMRGGLIN
jgi:hypothetical protein